MATIEKVRIDKWLWAIRIFKTRTLASDACKAGRVKINEKSVKASRMVQVGETVRVQKGEERKVVKALKLIEKRVGAPLAVKCYEDLSPKPDLSNRQRPIFYNFPVAKRERGTGRPTKKDRRDIDKLYDGE